MLDIGLNACSMSTNKCTNVHDKGGGKNICTYNDKGRGKTEI